MQRSIYMKKLLLGISELFGMSLECSAMSLERLANPFECPAISLELSA
jgi:hypothetical protein